MQVWQGKEVKSFKMNDLDVELIEQPVEPEEKVQECVKLRTPREVVEQFLVDHPDLTHLSNREIAERCGITEGTVRNYRKKRLVEKDPEFFEEIKEEIKQSTGEEVNLEELIILDHEYGTKEPTIIESTVEPQEERIGKKSASLSALQSSESNEWYTPHVYLDTIRELMGGIDLDPASCEEANRIVQAKRYYTEEDNGLAWDWWADEDETIPARVFLNPPYGFDEQGQSNQEVWSDRLIGEYEIVKSVREAILLVNAKTEAKWFQPLYNYPICLSNHRIHFWRNDKEPHQPTQGNAFIYFGTQRKRFIELFSKFGTIVCKAQPLDIEVIEKSDEIIISLILDANQWSNCDLDGIVIHDKSSKAAKLQITVSPRE